MCGVAGILSYGDMPICTRELQSIQDAMSTRGPDGSGIWLDESGRIGLAHRRLSILDLSERAAQPMSSVCGRYVISFNGEIYNYPELRKHLESKGRRFLTGSDTEVLLHLYELKNTDMLKELRGIFAFAIWDNLKQELLLARDPFGNKPLYYSNNGHTFRFASQVKAILAGGGVSRDPEPAGTVGYLLWGSVPDPFTIYRSILAVPAGSSVRVTGSGPETPHYYTRIADLLKSGEAEPVRLSEVNERVRLAASESVRAHLLADVEVGVFLSAGIDSGAILGLMRDAGIEKVTAITLAFTEFRNTDADEAPLARELAEYYGAKHIVRYVDEAEFISDLPHILNAMDQPTIDGINTWFVAKAAKEAGIKVALSGVGADELLGGYPSFYSIPRSVNAFGVPATLPGLGSLVRQAARCMGVERFSPKLPGLIEYGGTYPGAYLLK
jgi:asparagine synthase (glutamine-hydrolysing)